MYIKLIRNQPKGNALTGRMVVDGQWCCDTLEHWEYAIPKGFYRVRLTHSPHFNEVLPLLDHVIGYARDPHNGKPRTGIRIHAGNTIADTTGCILVGEQSTRQLSLKEESESRLLSSRHTLNELREYLFTYQTLNPYEEMYIEIIEPDRYPAADVPCPRELQQHVIDGQHKQQRYEQYLQNKRREEAAKRQRTGRGER